MDHSYPKPWSVDPLLPKPWSVDPSYPKPWSVDPSHPKPWSVDPSHPKPWSVDPSYPKPWSVDPSYPNPDLWTTPTQNLICRPLQLKPWSLDPSYPNPDLWTPPTQNPDLWAPPTQNSDLWTPPTQNPDLWTHPTQTLICRPLQLKSSSLRFSPETLTCGNFIPKAWSVVPPLQTLTYMSPEWEHRSELGRSPNLLMIHSHWRVRLRDGYWFHEILLSVGVNTSV